MLKWEKEQILFKITGIVSMCREIDGTKFCNNVLYIVNEERLFSIQSWQARRLNIENPRLETPSLINLNNHHQGRAIITVQCDENIL